MPFPYVSEKLKESKKKLSENKTKKETEGRDIYFNHNSHHS